MFCLCIFLILSLSESNEGEGSSAQNKDSKHRRGERVKVSRERWERAFEEIRAFRSSKKGGSPRTKGFFSQWKLLLDESNQVELDSQSNLTSTPLKKPQKPSRFEGFASWERILQEWSDDIQEYIDNVGIENSEYPMSTHGTPSSQLSASGHKHLNHEKESQMKAVHQAAESTRNDYIQLIKPAPARDDEEVLPHTDLADKSKRIWIVTTAALPWMTGTAVNPLLRAAYMTKGRKEAGGSVTLMLPWLERQKDQESVYGKDRVFGSPEEQEAFIRTWLRDTANLPEASEELRIDWYTSWQNKIENSLYSMGDITALIPEEEVDICILEEPEHLNWYRAPGDSWTSKFDHVVGIIHTNYFVYAQEQPAAFIRAPAMRLLCSWMCRAHCHRVIKLSGTLGQFAPEKELVENVHGVRFSFLDAGQKVKKRLELPSGASDDPIFGANAEPSVYFIGKMLWSKGLGSLMELLKYAEESAGTKVHVDMYGGGPDKDSAEARAKSLKVDMEFHGPIDHAELADTHKLFINPSTSEVLCTTVAEALAMGKFVLVPSHPSNDFFAQFPNCLTYTNKEEFVGNLYYALTHSPEPLTKEDSHALSWEAATERLEAAATIPVKEAEVMQEALASNEAGIEIALPLPSLIEDDAEGRKLIANLKRTRSRYRQFRSRLSNEIQQSDVLPSGMKQRLMSELEKRLDLDIDDMLASPKLRLKLSPGQLDKQLLELYKRVADGPSGDILRVIGGGQEVAFQDLYIKRRAAKHARALKFNHTSVSFGPFESFDTSGDESEEVLRDPSEWVKQAIRKNLRNDPVQITNSRHNNNNNNNNNLKMTTQPSEIHLRSSPTFSLQTTAKAFCPPRKSSLAFSLLI